MLHVAADGAGGGDVRDDEAGDKMMKTNLQLSVSALAGCHQAAQISLSAPQSIKYPASQLRF